MALKKKYGRRIFDFYMTTLIINGRFFSIVVLQNKNCLYYCICVYQARYSNKRKNNKSVSSTHNENIHKD